MPASRDDETSSGGVDIDFRRSSRDLSARALRRSASAWSEPGRGGAEMFVDGTCQNKKKHFQMSATLVLTLTH